MPELPRLNAKQVIKILYGQGFILSRQSGSHRIFNNLSGRRVTVPFHDVKILHPKVLKSIMFEAGISIEELIELV